MRNNSTFPSEPIRIILQFTVLKMLALSVERYNGLTLVTMCLLPASVVGVTSSCSPPKKNSNVDVNTIRGNHLVEMLYCMCLTSELLY